MFQKLLGFWSKLKKWQKVLLVIVVIFILLPSGNNKTKDSENSAGKEKIETKEEAVEQAKEEKEAPKATATPTPETNSGTDQKDLRKEFNNSLGDHNPIWYDSVRNDVTGNWRCLVVVTPETMESHAADYYKAYFTDDSEIHIIENLQLQTCSKIVVVYPGTLDVTVYEYVDKEEHDAKLMCSGMVLGQYSVNIETGEVEEITE